MKRLGELDNIQLLYDLKADALQPTDELIDDAGMDGRRKIYYVRDKRGSIIRYFGKRLLE